MKNANVRVLIIVFCLIAAVVIAAGVLGARQTADAPVVQSQRVQISPQPPEKTAETAAYVRLQIGNEVYPLIPLTDGGEYTVFQSDTGAKNVIHTTKTGAVMHFSTCDNQNCVQQGEVTLDNREMRVMGNMIVCLPNQVVVELVSSGEVE